MLAIPCTPFSLNRICGAGFFSSRVRRATTSVSFARSVRDEDVEVVWVRAATALTMRDTKAGAVPRDLVARGGLRDEVHRANCATSARDARVGCASWSTERR